MKFLYVDPVEITRKTHSVYLENILEDVELFVSTSFEGPRSAFEKFDEHGPFDLVAIHHPSDHALPKSNNLQFENFYNKVRKATPRCPIVLLGTSPNKEFKEKSPHNEVMTIPTPPMEFREIILKALSPSYGLRVVHAFQKIRLFHFLKFNKSLCNVYLKLSDHKYVKVLNADSVYERMDILKYVDKKISHFYLRNDDFEKYRSQILNVPFLQLEKRQYAPHELNSYLESNHLILKQMVCELGITEEAAKIAHSMINEVITFAEQKTELKTLFENFKKRLDYVYDHSFLISIVCCEILRNMHWNTEDKVKKLVLAAMFHDILVADPLLAQVQKKDDPRLKEFDPKTVKEYLSHPVETNLLISNFGEISPEVGLIILQHHENETDDGFPNGLHHSKLSLLSCIFILAHQYIFIFYEYDFDPDYQSKVLDRLKKTYSFGVFKPVLDALCLAKAPATGKPDV